MSCILVSGLINIETTLRVDGFPVQYYPVRYPFHQINMTVSGVGYNIAKALIKLGDKVDFLSIIGRDLAEIQVRSRLVADGISGEFVLSRAKETARSVILYDETGRRQINLDLKDIQEQQYPLEVLEQVVSRCDLYALCNINYSRAMLKRVQQAGKLIATDVHTISDLNDDYNRDFMQAAHILFMSDEALPMEPKDWARQVVRVYGTEIVVIGLGHQGALLSVRKDNFLECIPAIQIRPIVNTIGAGDALFSAFIHTYARTQDPYESIKKAVFFAAYKIGEKGAAEGFLDFEQLQTLYENYEN